MSIAEKLQTIAENVPKVYNAGYEKGKAEGGDTTEAYNQGVVDGKQEEYESFWNVYQGNRNRHNYNQAFAGYGWTDASYKPLYDFGLKSDGTYGLMYAAGMYQTSEITDTIKEFYIASSGANVQSMFSYASAIKTIRTIHTNENVAYASWFVSCGALENITFEGVIGNNIDLSPCTLLSKDSIENIIGCLSATASGKTAAFSKTAVNNAFEINIDDEATYPIGSEWYELRNSKSNWNFGFA